jgi:hypothetical protein
VTSPDRPSPTRLRALLAAIPILILLTIPLAAGIQKPGVTPPYAGAVAFASEVKSKCGVGQKVHPTANNTTGTVTMKNTVKGFGYFNPLRGSFVCSGSLTTASGFGGPSFAIHVSGYHLVKYTWAVNWSSNGSQSTANRSHPTLNISIFGNLFDLTTGKWVLGGNVSLNASATVFTAQCGNLTGTCWRSVGSAVRTLTLNLSLIGGHRYSFLTGLSTASYARGGLVYINHYLSGFGGAVTLDLSTSGNGATLVRMSVS